MFIKEILSQHRRDFNAIYECDHCTHTMERRGYDDRNYHDNVVPNISCPICFKKADEKTYLPLTTKYGDHDII